MALTLYYHPLASFSHKVLMALYENGTPFEGEVVNLGDRSASAKFFEMWPVGKIPVLHDSVGDRTIPETTVIIEYLDRHYPGPVRLLPDDEDQRLDVRLWDRFFDCYLHQQMQKIVLDRIRPQGAGDPHGVTAARATMATAYDMIEKRLASRLWVAGDAFSMADCAAAPPLFYGGIVAPFADTHPNTGAYFERLAERPSFRRIIAEARPFFRFFPYRDAMPRRWLVSGEA
jgi:glutathione S-transferase